MVWLPPSCPDLRPPFQLLRKRNLEPSPGGEGVLFQEGRLQSRTGLSALSGARCSPLHPFSFGSLPHSSQTAGWIF